MLRLIQFLIFGHVHKWTIINDVVLTNQSGARGSRYYLRCDHCGDVKSRDIL